MSNIPQKVLDYIEKKESVTTEELTERFGFKRITAYNYLSRLRKEGFLTRVGHGRYRLGNYERISLDTSPRVKQITNLIKERMPFIEFTIWSTEDLATSSHYAMGKNVVFIEANKRVSQKIKDVILENNIRSLVEPSKKRMSDIFYLLEEPVVIFQRKDSYATFTQNNIRFPQPEKMIIDLYFYITRLDFPYPPDEYGRVLYYILKNKNLNFDRLKRYASRRGLNEEFSNLLSRMKDKYPELNIPRLKKASEIEATLNEIVEGALL